MLDVHIHAFLYVDSTRERHVIKFNVRQQK